MWLRACWAATSPASLILMTTRNSYALLISRKVSSTAADKLESLCSLLCCCIVARGLIDDIPTFLEKSYTGVIDSPSSVVSCLRMVIVCHALGKT